MYSRRCCNVLLFWGSSRITWARILGGIRLVCCFQQLNLWRKHFVAILLCFMGIFPIGAYASQGNDIAFKLALSKSWLTLVPPWNSIRNVGSNPFGWIVRVMRESDLVPYFLRLRTLLRMVCLKGLFDARAIRNDIRSIRTSADLAWSKEKLPALIYNMHR